MRKYIIVTVIVLLVLFNAILLGQNHKLKKVEYPSYSYEVNEGEKDLRGMYTYPGIGALFVSRDAGGLPVRAPLSLAIFFSAKTSCPASLSEVESYRRLVPIFRERGQVVVAVTSEEDSVAIAEFLEQEKLDIPLVVLGSDGSEGEMNFEQMGISPLFMPFKILYDSMLTAIYMRGADNTPESQAEFEAAMLWLSEIVAGHEG